LAALLSHYIGAGDTDLQGDAAGALLEANAVTVDDTDGQRWEFVRGDCQAWLAQQRWHGRELVYADPPYLLSVRASGRLFYEYELAEESEHVALLAQLRALPCMVMISGYWSELYADMLAGWTTVTYTTTTLGGTVAEEWLWMNYPLPTALHDYRYLGEDYRERERIKRKVSRWRSRLADMPLLERQALMMALSEIDLAAVPPQLASVASKSLAETDVRY
jgi:DNA adenine methylase